MANDRLGIRCVNCNEVFWFAKTFLDGYYISGNPYYIGKALDMFLDKHTYCEGCTTDGDFDLIYWTDNKSNGTKFFEPKFSELDQKQVEATNAAISADDPGTPDGNLDRI